MSNSPTTLVKGLQNEYDKILSGEKKKFSRAYFDFASDVNEKMALSVFKYAIENYLEWNPTQAATLLNKDVINQMKLTPLLRKITFPQELEDTDYWYIVHKIYPTKIPVNKRALISKMYAHILASESKKFPKEYFYNLDGSVKACVCLQYVLEHYLVYNTVDDMYKDFASSNMLKRLSRFKLANICQMFYDSPLDYLHAALPMKYKDEFLYNFYLYKQKEQEVKKDGDLS